MCFNRSALHCEDALMSLCLFCRIPWPLARCIPMIPSTLRSRILIFHFKVSPSVNPLSILLLVPLNSTSLLWWIRRSMAAASLPSLAAPWQRHSSLLACTHAFPMAITSIPTSYFQGFSMRILRFSNLSIVPDGILLKIALRFLSSMPTVLRSVFS